MKHTVSTYDLSFGSKAHLINIPSDPLLNFKIFLNSGDMYCDESKTETSHILEHCLFEKNKLFSNPLEFKMAIEKIGAVRNGFTGYKFNNYIINGSVEKYKEIISMLLNLVNGVEFKEEIFNQQKEVVRNEMNMYSNDLTREIVLGMQKHITGNSLTSGERHKIIDNVKFEDIKDFYSKYYSPANSTFFLSGNLEGKEREIINMLEDYYADKDKGENTFKEFKVSPDYNKSMYYIEDEKKTNMEFRMRFLIDTNDEKIRKLYRFFSYIFMVGSGSRIQQKAREKGLIYSLMNYSGIDNGYISFQFGEKVPEEKIFPLLKLIFDEVKDILGGNVSQEEIDRAKGLFEGGALRNFQTGEQILNYYIDKFAYNCRGVDFDEYVDSIKDFSKEDLIEFSKYFDFQRWSFGLLCKNAKSKSEEIAIFLDEHVK